MGRRAESFCRLEESVILPWEAPRPAVSDGTRKANWCCDKGRQKDHCYFFSLFPTTIPSPLVHSTVALWHRVSSFVLLHSQETSLLPWSQVLRGLFHTSVAVQEIIERCFSSFTLIRHHDHSPNPNPYFHRKTQPSNSYHAIPSGPGSRERSWAQCYRKCRLVMLVQGRPWDLCRNIIPRWLNLSLGGLLTILRRRIAISPLLVTYHHLPSLHPKISVVGRKPLSLQYRLGTLRPVLHRRRLKSLLFDACLMLRLLLLLVGLIFWHLVWALCGTRDYFVFGSRTKRRMLRMRFISININIR